ncbi:MULTISPECIES: protein-disulfide reductase DsbD [Pseudoalteromonas]|uniref:Thiol:disulfide interchange protein DsbD n=1 Tax=Pseudoalteromonas amylolytica TaxID=1859457 RepID=A0A1S1MS74_9GAMM|nr:MULTISPECIES: protein-disulfide reductase DsbD [Pseudoalteromonas]OHU86184.1 protein-disulfide reductase DsbD [Pseudoalteromonas sp. JW3]OHU89709.1 protein-disulfide reductase DsbD [Pseudoalteromonas amylolytica]
MRALLFVFSLLWLLPAQANNDVLNSLLAPKQDTFLPVNEAFKFDFDQQGNILFTGWDIAPGYYLYKKKLEIIAKNADIKVGEYTEGVEIEDEFFGKTQVYFDSFSVVSKLSNIGDDAVVKIRYQGCAEAGLCYPPEVITIPLSPLAMADGSTASADSATTAPPVADQTPSSDKELSFTERLASQSLLTNLAIFFMVGVGLAFTPCVFPMFPILSSLIAGQKGLSTKRAFSLSFVYVQGMAVTYALLGLVVAALGGQVQGYLQHPAVLISFSLLFVLLAMAMFGWYEIKLPSGMMNRLTAISNQQQGGNYLGVFSMGVLSGLIASPCTTAPLSAALLYVAQSGDYFIGGITLYSLSLGMGLPLLLLGTSGGKLLPKAGAWMEQVKTLFGFIMLVVPLILLERIVEFDIILWLASGLMLATALYLHHWQSQQSSGVLKTLLWGVASVLLVSALLVGKNLIWPSKTINVTQAQSAQGEKKFQLVADLSALREAIEQANDNGQIAIVDLYADWCVACKEFEKYTFFEPQVQQQFKHFALLKLDLTESNDKSVEIMKEFNVFGLPTMLFFDGQGNELPDLRVTGFMGPEPFAKHLEKVRANVQ